VLAVLRESRDFFPLGATGSENCSGKWREFFYFLQEAQRGRATCGEVMDCEDHWRW